MNPLLRALFALLLAASTSSAYAQLQITPEPGKWESRTVLNVSGFDAFRIQSHLLGTLPAEQREQVLAQMRAAGVSTSEPGVARYCVSAAQSEKAKDPKAAIADINRSVPQCKFEPTEVGANDVQFRGRCDDPRSFTGNVQGVFTITERKSWSMDFRGRGSLAGLSVGGSQMPAQGRTVARWVSAECDPPPGK